MKSKLSQRKFSGYFLVGKTSNDKKCNYMLYNPTTCIIGKNNIFHDYLIK